jgi:alkaline phosphatase D
MLDLSNIASALKLEGRLSRRLFLGWGSTLAALPMLENRSSAAGPSRFAADPFTLGVASGDPDSNSLVLWTRLASKPLDPDGGMGKDGVELVWELADDERFTRNARSGKVVAGADLGHSVRVVVEGLEPNRPYFYRFRAGDATSPIGRTHTTPDGKSLPETLKFAFASCQHYEAGLYTAYERMAKDQPDLVFHLGDYIYEGAAGTKGVRKHSGPKIKSLSDYRVRHAQYRSDPLLHRMHAQCPWVVTWDDHEFENNYAAGVSQYPAMDPAEFLKQRANAYQAYYEAMPLRPESVPHGPDMKLYRTLRWGRLAEFQVLDTRQYRTDQPNGDGRKELNADALSPKNTLLGAKQRQWLESALAESKGHWNVLAQQVMMGMVGYSAPKGGPLYSMDQWPGAAHERMKLMQFIAGRKVANPVVLTGDIHSNWVNNLRIDDRKPDTACVATEFVGTSISSGGNTKTDPDAVAKIRTENPIVQLQNRDRGYVLCTVTPKEWRSEYVAVEDVLKPGGKCRVTDTFVVENGRPGATRA